ncbi:MCP four helix bundle domain-containing protein [Desertifilum sp. FACHB-1129]|uniref:Methyl-accepting transducer domain-containing protein n=1 Tax=Desertifilum tharense IPPAS B-1220 TaxID=1781255 RepID=A0A1E5QNP6_9CYAN|nr:MULTISPECIES: methyl-accepting chemotaxis protein [Desertifilum]MDA0212192.1 methyl-accepting chemotaxis protein [Cyanobacteria bacterium FC1]MBD2312771.1 MCP four helix bundle domain-containing protein [Desertifilum sp. FACHB-1129]MBD2324135.1 MCP four helix bundle domain-containing protein [Desertifilum sp. FACHB-866]MBD2334149.1 MCP four helix bundle domain-containing protein [Desertifilum sp. FACHB-868]OEJ76217.1 hypothetical protein BH720_05105 [Desertifilum tharense IPPAS B-1220]
MKLSTKLYLGFAIPAVALVGIGAYSIYGFNRIDRAVTTIYDDRIVPLQSLKTISDRYAIDTIDAVNKANSRLISPDSARQTIDRAIAQAQQEWQLYKQTQFTPQEAQLVAQTENLLLAADREVAQVQQVLNAQDFNQLANYNRSLYLAIDPLTEQLQQLSQLQLQVALQERDRTEAIYQETLWFFIPFLVVALLLGSPVGFAIVKRAIVATLADNIDEIVRSMNGIATATAQHERIALSQVSSVHQTTTAVDRVESTSQESARQAQLAVSRARQALTLSETGSQSMSQNLQQMSQLKQKVAQMQQQIHHLSEQTQQIGAIAELVNGIANQTNMLALNAAIEAVRAGDRGQGFAVISQEIRKLSDQSQKSTEQIHHLVAQIQSAIAQTQKVTLEETQTVEDGVKIAAETASIFANVGEAISEVVSSFQQISDNANQQANALQQIAMAMNALTQASQETTSGITQTKNSTQKLQETTLNLKTML